MITNQEADFLLSLPKFIIEKDTKLYKKTIPSTNFLESPLSFDR